MSVAGRIARYERPFEPPWWARGGHAQTIAGHLLLSLEPSLRNVEGVERREVELADGDRIVALAARGNSGVRVHLFHGLSGDVDSDYMRRAAARMRRRGHGVWAVNHRGCGDGRGLAAKPYHSGRSDDLRAVLEASRAEAPDALHIVVGFSMSGNIALLHASEDEPLAHAVLAINPVIDLADASERISHGVARLYELRFVRRLRADLRDRQQRGLIAREFDVSPRATLREFDDAITAPLGGFRDADDYYERCSSLSRLAQVRVPTVIVAASDDPFLDIGLYATKPRADCVMLHEAPHGGHLGYVARGGERWIDGAIEHYVEELVKAARR